MQLRRWRSAKGGVTGAQVYATLSTDMLMVTGMILGKAAGGMKLEAPSRDVVQPRGAVVHQVLQPPGRGHQHIHAPLQGLGLHTVTLNTSPFQLCPLMNDNSTLASCD